MVCYGIFWSGQLQTTSFVFKAFIWWSTQADFHLIIFLRTVNLTRGAKGKVLRIQCYEICLYILTSQVGSHGIIYSGWLVFKYENTSWPTCHCTLTSLFRNTIFQGFEPIRKTIIPSFFSHLWAQALRAMIASTSSRFFSIFLRPKGYLLSENLKYVKRYLGKFFTGIWIDELARYDVNWGVLDQASISQAL